MLLVNAHQLFDDKWLSCCKLLLAFFLLGVTELGHYV